MNIQFPKYENIEKFCLQNFNLAYNCFEDLTTNFEKYQGQFENSFSNVLKKPPIYFEWNSYRFPVFIHQDQKELFSENGKINFDIFLNIFLFLSGFQEILCEKKDSHGRFPFNESLQAKYGFTEIPVVNIYFDLLYETALKNNIRIERISYKKPIIFTHDIDQLRSGWFENIQFELSHFSCKSFWRIPKNIFIKTFGLKDDFHKGMEKMLLIDKENNIEAVSFFLVDKSHKNADFDITKNKFKSILAEAKKSQELGIHPTYEAFDNEYKYETELNKLQKFTNNKITKSRQHFLRYNIEKTPFIQEKIGIEEDYTLGFAEQYGFRNGITNPFYLYNFEEQRAFKVKQIPLVFMDVTLINYTLKNDFKKVLQFIDNINSNFNCNFSILFHNSVFSDGKYEGFEEMYQQLISISQKK